MFPFFPLPQVVANFAPPLWDAFTALLVICMAVAIAVGIVALGGTAMSGQYDKETAQIGWIFIGAAVLIFFFHLWLILIAAVGFTLYLLIYWVMWRMLIKNLLVALGVK